ncbi:Dihydrolipoyllysine-residue acetyltransferase component of pyruvate dehydrogenase complex [archaeon HR01]|nr:Dihydrolipoyllysine-residue acetyltransferase component of pyruvate dehydrogenase complex [archaeon HR01]
MVVVRLPDIGEGIAEGEILRWLVKEGDVVEKYQPLAEIMTVKVNVEVPSPYRGRVVQLLAKEGDVLSVGSPLLEIETEEAVAVEAPRPPPAPHASMAEARESRARVMATPAVKKLARELGVDLEKVVGSGPGGRILEEDVRRAAAKPVEAEKAVRIPIRGLRRMISEKLVAAKNRAALVTVFETVDASELVSLRDELRGRRSDVRLTYLPLIMKAVVAAVREYPQLNGWIDDERGEIVLSKEVNIGVAVDTPEGLMVPIVKNVESKDIWTLASEVEELSARARSGKLSLDDVRGGTISISNYGALGSLSGTPIVNFPEIAIVGVGRIEKRPVVRNDVVVVGQVMDLAVTMDHRAVDGGLMGGFVLALKRHIEKIRETVGEV